MPIQVVIALLPDNAVFNLARSMALEMCRRAGVPLAAARYPAHISLKQGFQIDSLKRIEAWFDGLCASVAPVELAFDRVYYLEWSGLAVVGFNVVESPVLRGLHNRLNCELAERFGDVSAPFDGDDYRFHLTVEMGPITDDNPYRRYYDALTDTTLALRCTARDAALFVNLCESDASPYIVYKMLALGIYQPEI